MCTAAGIHPFQSTQHRAQQMVDEEKRAPHDTVFGPRFVAEFVVLCSRAHLTERQSAKASHSAKNIDQY
jgi:hypothetical protein